jgi:hypothetical protein
MEPSEDYLIDYTLPYWFCKTTKKRSELANYILEDFLNRKTSDGSPYLTPRFLMMRAAVKGLTEVLYDLLDLFPNFPSNFKVSNTITSLTLVSGLPSVMTQTLTEE